MDIIIARKINIDKVKSKKCKYKYKLNKNIEKPHKKKKEDDEVMDDFINLNDIGKL